MKFVVTLTVTLLAMLAGSHSISAEFPLDSTQFVSAKMPMHMVYPRPSSETSADARHKWAHSGFEYQIPVGVQGGAWPFKYELTASPAGATIGEYFTDADYGVISWTPTAASGTETFTVKVTDQDLNTVTVSWDVQINDDKFVFIQDQWSGDRTGTIDAPLEDFADWYLGDRTDTTFAGKIVVFRGGSYSLIGDTVNNGNVNYSPDSKTRSFIAYPGETVVVDGSSAQFVYSSDINDLYVSGINWDNGRTDWNNPQFFWFTADASRVTFWDNTFSNLTAGTSGNDNTAPLFFNNNRTDIRENILIKSNLFDSIYNTSGQNGSLVDIYSASYVLIESNTVSNSHTNYGFWMKYTENYVTVRDNVAVDNVNGKLIVIGGSGTSGNAVHDTEVCWNRLSLGSNTSTDAYTWSGGGSSHYNDYFYRNTVIGKPAFLHPGSTSYQSSYNIIVSNSTTFFYRDYVDHEGEVVFGTSAGAVDAEGFLTGSARTDYLGLAGSELIGRYTENSSAPVFETGDVTKTITE